MTLVTRFAPSPTGNMHIGGLRTALYCYALTKKYGGKYILRLEDTDRKRFVDGAAEEIIELLNEFGVPPTDLASPDKLSKIGNNPETSNNWILDHEKTLSVNDDDFKNDFIQSQRLPVYQKYALKLLKDGYAYCCFRTSEELKQLREDSERNGHKKIDLHRQFTLEESIEKIKKGEDFVVRMDVNEYKKRKNITTVIHDDTVMGKMEFPLDEVTDQIIIKSDGIPTYHLAVVVDDHLMGVTHPMRAAEWIPSTPKQVLIYDMLGWEMPRFVHLTAILDPEGGKLSKRKGSVAAKEFLKEGYLPEAIMNFLMLLGWSSPSKRKFGESEQEFYTISQFVELFELHDLNKSNPVFNREKLLWFNQKYIQNLTPDAFVIKFTKWFEKFGEDEELKKEIIAKGPDYLEKVLIQVHERAKLLSEIPTQIHTFYFPNTKDEVFKVLAETKHTSKLDKSQIDGIIKVVKEELTKQKDVKSWGHENWEKIMREIADKNSIKAGEAFMTLRIVVLGSPISPPLFESMEIMEKEEVLKRIESVLA